MTGSDRTFLGALIAALVSMAAAGCEAPGVGDPCEPEQVPEGGFVRTEAYLETSSVQCRTRVCMVYKLPGTPNFVNPDGTVTCVDSATTVCASIQETADRVYCTCRCDAPSGSNATLCECPDGYSCEPVLELGGAGIQGSYCVKSRTIGAGGT